MGAPYHGPSHGRPMPYPNSPHQAARSPALQNAHPVTPQMNQVPMAHPQMPNQNYGGYNQHMAPPNNYPHGFEHNYYYPGYGVQQQNMYMTPSSPQPRPGIPYVQPGAYMANQFPPAGVQPPAQSTPLSRNSSQISNDRPGSSLGQGSAQAATPATSHAHTASRTSNSPAPQKNHFIIPTPKKSAIVIKDPNSGAVKSFEKQQQPASPARATPSPVKGSAPTPPPRTASGADHARTESKSVKTDEEKKKELRDAVRMKIEQDEAENRRKEEDARKALEGLSLADKDSKPEEPAAAEPVKQETQPKVDEPKEEKKPEEKPEEKPAAAPAPADDEIDFDAIERELAEIEAKELAAEQEYYKKKQAEKEEKERKEKEEAEAYERNMKQAEREAEAAEEARMKKLEASGEEDTSKKDADLFASLRKGGFPATESAAPPTPDDSGTATPVSVSDASMGPPSKPASVTKAKPGPLKLETKAVEPPQPSAALKSLHSAKFLDSLASVTYPTSIVSPNPALNANAPSDRKFKYNKEFLLQFQNVFKEKPTLDWDVRVRETVGDSGDSSRPQSARTPGAGRVPSHKGIPSFKMGNFVGANPPAGGPGRDGFPNAGRVPTMGGSPFGSFGRPGSVGTPISRGPSSGGMYNGPQASRPGSTKGSVRQPSKKQSAKKEEDRNNSMPLTANAVLKPLAVSTTGWKPRSVGSTATAAGPTPGGDSTYLAPDVVQRKVKANLNKMTPENFERISEQILAIVSQSKDESDGRTLRQVIQLTFEKATDEAHWAPMYAKFCKRMLESMSADIKDENIKDKNGNVVAGGSLFRKYLLNRCQEEFERGWKINLPEKPEGVTEEIAMMSDEYYAAAAAKRRGLGLVKFIGELYKLGMLTERIMHECVKKLVDYEGIPDEAEVESLTSLLRTIGASLDVSEKGHVMMDAYFGRITMMIETPNLPSRLRFMLMDVVDLRSANWVSKTGDKGPKTITEIREEAARAQHEAEMERLRQQANRGGGRMPLGRGDARNFSGDYRNQAPPPDFASSKVGTDDLRRLKTARTANQPVSFGPSSLFGSRSNSGRKNLGPGGNLVRGGEDSGASSRTGTPPAGKKEDKEAASSINAFSALASLEDNMATSPPSNPTSPELTKSQPVKSQGEAA